MQVATGPYYPTLKWMLQYQIPTHIMVVSGWQLDINSTLICYGTHNTGKTAAASKLIFPVSFTTTNYSIAGTISHSFGTGGAYFPYYDSVNSANIVLWIRNSSGSNYEGTIKWCAIGY